MKELEAFQNALKHAKGLKAKELASRARCSIPTVYRRIRSLEKLGAVVAVMRTRRSKTGPTPRTFLLVRPAQFPDEPASGPTRG